MGIEIPRREFRDEDFAAFSARLGGCLVALERLMARRGFGEGPVTFGAELEAFLVDAEGRPLMINDAVLATAGDDSFTVELNRFNVECNTEPVRADDAPFRRLHDQFHWRLTQLDEAASRHGGKIAVVGILPTLRETHFDTRAMTDSPRYRALARLLRQRREGPFEFRIDGDDSLRLVHEDVTLEGAGTSLQLHLKVPPDEFAAVYNAAQLATCPALAAAGNSPLLLEHRLWEETRVALFKQSVDERTPSERLQHRQPRVTFGSGWVEHGALELFRENVHHFDPVLPVVGEADPVAETEAGRTPELSELRLHSGTVWRWNRPVYDPADGGHVRLELRALPAGPTVADMLANAAFLLGVTMSLSREPGVARSVPFHMAENNFYRAAQLGLDATLLWPKRGDAREVAADALCLDLLEPAKRGLEAIGVPASDFEPWLDVLERRVRCRQTGARWQRSRLERLERGQPRREALHHMLLEYISHQRRGLPVHEWPL